MHERAYVESLGSVVERFEDGAADAVAWTRDAMGRGVEIIVQGAISVGRWWGRTDVLRRVEGDSALGGWHYEVIDTKLGSETRARTILQLASSVAGGSCGEPGGSGDPRDASIDAMSGAADAAMLDGGGETWRGAVRIGLGGYQQDRGLRAFVGTIGTDGVSSGFAEVTDPDVSVTHVKYLEFSSDGSTFFYASKIGPGITPYDLFAVVIEAGQPGPTRRLGASEPGHPGVKRVVPSPTDRRVLYVAEESTFLDALFLADAGNPDAPPERLSSPAGDIERAYGIFWSPDGKRALFVDRESLDAPYRPVLVDLEGEAPHARVVVDVSYEAFESPVYLRVSPDWTKLLCATVDGLVMVDISGARPSAPISIDGDDLVGGYEFEFTSDSRRVIFLAPQLAQGRLYEVDVAGASPLQPRDLSGPMVANGFVKRFWLSPDGAKLVYLANQEDVRNFELFYVTLGGGPSTPIKLNPPYPQPEYSPIGIDSFVTFLPDSTRMIVSVEHDGTGKPGRYLMNVDDVMAGTMTRITPELSSGQGLTASILSRDGSRYLYGVSEGNELFISTLDDRPPVKVSGDLGGGTVLLDYRLPAFSPDGGGIFYAANPDDPSRFELFFVDVSGSEPQPPVALGPEDVISVSTFGFAMVPLPPR